MHAHVTVTFSPLDEFRFDLDEVQPMPHDVARWWLDDQFQRLGCEPLRASGKVLTADKALLVAQAAAPTLLADAKWATEFARAVSAALGKPVVHIDATARSVTF